MFITLSFPSFALFDRIPLNASIDSECDIFVPNSPVKLLLEAADLIIWDECGCQRLDDIMCVDRSLRKLLHKDTYFGGKPVLFSADFRQTAPVVRGYHFQILITF